jgi:hypothetical protein
MKNEKYQHLYKKYKKLLAENQEYKKLLKENIALFKKLQEQNSKAIRAANLLAKQVATFQENFHSDDKILIVKSPHKRRNN